MLILKQLSGLSFLSKTSRRLTHSLNYPILQKNIITELMHEKIDVNNALMLNAKEQCSYNMLKTYIAEPKSD